MEARIRNLTGIINLAGVAGAIAVPLGTSGRTLVVGIRRDNVQVEKRQNTAAASPLELTMSPMREFIITEPEIVEENGLLVFRHLEEEDWDTALDRDREARLASFDH